MECEGFEDVEDKKLCGIECEGNWGSKECNCKARRLGKGGGGRVYSQPLPNSDFPSELLDLPTSKN